MTDLGCPLEGACTCQLNPCCQDDTWQSQDTKPR